MYHYRIQLAVEVIQQNKHQFCVQRAVEQRSSLVLPSALLTLGAHALRGLQYLLTLGAHAPEVVLRVCVCVCVCVSVRGS